MGPATGLSCPHSLVADGPLEAHALLALEEALRVDLLLDRLELREAVRAPGVLLGCTAGRDPKKLLADPGRAICEYFGKSRKLTLTLPASVLLPGYELPVAFTVMGIEAFLA